MRALPTTLLLGIALVVSGCLATPDDDPADADDGTEAYEPSPQVVVAVVDSGVNVYHEAFQREDLPDEALQGFTNTLDDEAPERIRLHQEGDYDERLEADQDVWAGMERNTLYYFEGTNILGISFDESEHPVLDDGSHGTGTAGSVTAANPDALVVLVEGIGSDSEAWAASQPWIDFMSLSYGPPIGGPHVAGPVSGLTTSQATHLAWQNGKIPVGASDNSPQPAFNDETSGPPWVVGVAGDHLEEQCRNHISGTAPDFTAEFTQDLPSARNTSEYRSASGTSFATPTTAGVMSKVLLEVRQAWNHTGGITDGAFALSPEGDRLTNVELRAAFNQTAVYFDDLDPCDGTSLPVNPAAPWLQQGWGNINPEITNATRDHLLGVQEAPAKAMEAQLFMEGLATYREAAWGLA